MGSNNSKTKQYSDSLTGDCMIEHLDDNGKVVKRENKTRDSVTYYEGENSITPYRHNDLPSYVIKDGTRQWTDKQGRLHRLNGPALMNNCKNYTEMKWCEDRQVFENITGFFDCDEKWYYHGLPVSKEWMKENGDILKCDRGE